MPIQGSCLCGAVRFEITGAAGPFELCHCNRCRKSSGAAALPMLRVLRRDFRFVAGEDRIRTYDAPILYRPPAYRWSFCERCGSPAPTLPEQGDSLEIPAGLFDDDPRLRPDKHIFVELVPDWDRIEDDLPQYTIRALHRERYARELPDDFELRIHGRPRGEPRSD